MGDPTEAALVVLAAKMGVDAEQMRRTYPRIAEVPFDSAYKFMATFHHLPLEGQEHFVEIVKDARTDVQDANASLSRKGLRVLAFAVRTLDGRESDVTTAPERFVNELTFVGMVGIIDPIRPEAAAAVARPLRRVLMSG